VIEPTEQLPFGRIAERLLRAGDERSPLGAICQEGFAPRREAAEDMLAESVRSGTGLLQAFTNCPESPAGSLSKTAPRSRPDLILRS
jgi:hypothetical protein